MMCTRHGKSVKAWRTTRGMYGRFNHRRVIPIFFFLSMSYTCYLILLKQSNGELLTCANCVQVFFEFCAYLE